MYKFSAENARTVKQRKSEKNTRKAYFKALNYVQL